MSKLISLPKHEIEVLESFDKPAGFLSACSKKVRITYDSDEPEKPEHSETTIDYVSRNASFDAVCIVPYYVGPGGEVYVYLVSCIRPALAFRNYASTNRLERVKTEDPSPMNQWELPAGIVERNEIGYEGLAKAASRELKEEVGIFVSPNYFFQLGNRVFSSVGLSGERIYFMSAEVHPRHQDVPTTDGGPLEKGSVIANVTLQEALYFVKMDHISDAKTVIGLMRLAQKLNCVY